MRRLVGMALAMLLALAACSGAAFAAPKSAALVLNARTLRLGAGERFALQPVPDSVPEGARLEYASSAASVVAVAEDGELTALRRGKAKITVTAPDGAKATCSVTVVKPPSTIKLMANNPRLVFDAAAGRGEKTALRVTLSRGSASAITYSGYDPAVVEVSAGGAVVAVGPGTTSITASTFNGKVAMCTVRVLEKGRDRAVNVAHRGGHSEWPENTLEAFQSAAQSGADAVELDVNTTLDGYQVVYHDSSFTIRSRRYRIEKLTLEQLRRLRPGICTLDEALEMISETGLGLLLELKASAVPKACVEAVRRYDMRGRTLYISFEAALLGKVKALEPTAKLGCLIGRTPANLGTVIASLRPAAICQQEKSLTRANLLKWQNQGLLVAVWTPNERKNIENWLDMGVDYIISDYPKLVAAAQN